MAELLDIKVRPEELRHVAGMFAGAPKVVGLYLRDAFGHAVLHTRKGVREGATPAMRRGLKAGWFIAVATPYRRAKSLGRIRALLKRSRSTPPLSTYRAFIQDKHPVALAHEQGADITPTKAKWLLIPIAKELRRVDKKTLAAMGALRPRRGKLYQGRRLFFRAGKDGNAALLQEPPKGAEGKNAKPRVIYALRRQVRIRPQLGLVARWRADESWRSARWAKAEDLIVRHLTDKGGEL